MKTLRFLILAILVSLFGCQSPNNSFKVKNFTRLTDSLLTSIVGQSIHFACTTDVVTSKGSNFFSPLFSAGKAEIKRYSFDPGKGNKTLQFWVVEATYQSASETDKVFEKLRMQATGTKTNDAVPAGLTYANDYVIKTEKKIFWLNTGCALAYSNHNKIKQFMLQSLQAGKITDSIDCRCGMNPDKPDTNIKSTKSNKPADVNWLIEQSWPDEFDFVPNAIKSKKIKTPNSVLHIFSLSSFAAPDSIIVTYYSKKSADSTITECYFDKIKFLDIFSSPEDTTDKLPCNSKTLKSVNDYFKDCQYKGLSGYVNISNREICFIFGDGNWTRKERFIYSCKGCVRISDQGHSQDEFKIYWNKKLLDSSICDGVYY